MKKIFQTFCILFVCVTNLKAQENQTLKLWYIQPANNWNEALPVGNGRLGAMVFGGIEKEVIQLNEETVWAGEPGNNILPEVKEYLPEIRKLIFEEKHEEAQKLANKYLPRRAGDMTNYGMCYQPVGNLQLTFSHKSKPESYYRDLNISEAVANVSYIVDGITYSRKVLSSYVDDVIAIEISADKPKSISFSIGIDCPHDNYKITTSNNVLYLNGLSGDYENKKGKVKYCTIVKPKITGGNLTSTDSTLIIKDADKVIIYLSIGTNFKDYKDISVDEKAKAQKLLDDAYSIDFADLLQKHTEYYKKYFNRVKIELGSTDSIKNPTNIRLEQFNTGNDPQLISLYYQFGRYLLISSSQPGTQAANLQGIWNNNVKPPWDSKYTVNINTEMNYWPAEPTNLSEMHQPLFDLIDDISETGKESASKMYGARGWNIHHNTDLWRVAGVIDGGYYGLWPMGGAWLTQHIWYHYLYTGDLDFLKAKYNLLKEASLFYKDILVEEPEHKWMVVCPSMSPENAHHSGTTIAAGTTMDNQLIFDVFNNLIKASSLLDIDKEYADSLQNILQKMAPMQIGKWGQLQEWMHDWDKEGDKHRHVSHLYGLYPSNQISPYKTPELFSAAKKSLLARGDESTGWSMGWKVNLWARLLDGNHALKLISDQLTPSIKEDGSEEGGTYPNLFDAHPPFQIDGNFGCTSGITEMLLQSHDGAIHLLPALPDSWTKGEITGLKARGGFEVDINWAEGKIQKVIIKSEIGGNCRIRSYFPLKAKGLKKAKGENKNNLFDTPNIKTYLHKTDYIKPTLNLRKIYEYDIDIKKGESVQIFRL